jgi:flagellin
MWAWNINQIMALSINTNIASITTQRHLNKSRAELNTAMERLSSGKRINSAKDDAAGLAISQKMTAQIEGLRQAVRNSNDAISLAQTAEGAMEESTAILQRMRVLALQSINDTNTASDRSNLNDEYEQLTTELSRIANTTVFNNTPLLKDGYSGTFQVGHQAGETISLAIGNLNANEIGTTYDVAIFDIFAADSPAKGDQLSLSIRGADGYGGDLTVIYTAAKAETATQTAAGMVSELNSNSTFSQKYQAFSDANNSVSIRRTDGTGMGLPIRAEFDLTPAGLADVVEVTIDGVATGGAAKDYSYTVNSTDGVTATAIATGVASKLNADTNGFGQFYIAFSNEGKVEIRAKDGTNVDTSKITVVQETASAVDTKASTAVTLNVTAFLEVDATASVTIDGTVFTTGALVAADIHGKDAAGQSAALAAKFAAISKTGWDIANSGNVVTFAKNASYVGGTTGGTATDDAKSIIDTEDRPQIYINHSSSGGGVVSATAVDTAGITLAAGRNSKVINERIGFEVSVSPRLFMQGALSFSGVVLAVDEVVDHTDVLSASAAMQSVRVVDDAIAMIGREQAGLGAFQNRLEHAVSNLSNMTVNTESAKSKILDTDYAVEASRLAKNQILQQVGIAMLAQANATKDLVISLLRNLTH